jgi:hypothetical protein
MACTVAGDKARVGAWIRDIVALIDADELMIDCRIYDAQARLRSHQYAAESMEELIEL